MVNELNKYIVASDNEGEIININLNIKLQLQIKEVVVLNKYKYILVWKEEKNGE